MFRLESLELVHWDYWQRFALPLDASIVTVVGPNGSGKTTLLDALRTLLAIPCSAGRDYKRYVRRSEAPYAWLRAVASNPRRASGQLAFWPITEPQVTLFCQIRKKGGDWERRYGIGRGVIPIEAAETSPDIEWVGVRQYESRLEYAGVTRAIKRVLALDQGHTDKLCEYSGRQLLELVFDVFGDQEVLENYRKAREDQAACARELEALEAQRDRLKVQLQAAEGDVDRYHTWRSLKDELADLECQWLPRLEFIRALDSVRGERNQLQGRLRERRDTAVRLEAAERRLAEAAERLVADEAEKARADAALQRLHEEERQLHRAQGKVEALLEERARLLALAAEQDGGFDAEAALKEQARLNQRQFELGQQLAARRQARDELREKAALLGAGRRPEPPEVRAFRAALDSAGIEHLMLADVVSIREPAWATAVESVLAGLRHVVLLARPQDRARAWALGEQHGFRHYVVAERAPAPAAAPGTLAACVAFSAPPPAWLPRLLADIACVESVEAGARLPETQSWITPKGYQRERRGGRFIGVADAHFGSNVLAQVEAALEQAEAEVVALEQARAQALERLSALQARLAGVSALEQLAAREQAFSAAEEEAQRLRERLEALKSEKAPLAQAVYALASRVQAAAVAQALAEEERSRLAQEARTLLAELRQLLPRYRANWKDLRARRRSLPVGWQTEGALAEARARFDDAASVQREIERQAKRLNEGHWVTDPSCEAIRDKLAGDLGQLDDRIQAQRAHLARAESSTERARAQYIGVLRTTVKRYGANLKRLGALAGIGVEITPPQLAPDDLALSQAALEVRFDFDQKGLIGLNDGEASGGQQVMKSMILLVGLMAEEGDAGGFVFIDEPFAHLDIFNIDRVGGFLKATQAQYIVTTPNTHNVNVFQPSDLTLVTQKRRPGQAFAPPVAFLRRAVGA